MTPITFTLTLDDMVEANRLALRRYVRKGLPRSSLAVIVAALGVTLIAYAFHPQPIGAVVELFIKIVGLYILVAAGIAGYVWFIAPRQRAKKNIAQMPALSRSQTVEWDDTTFTISSENSHAVVPLTDVHQWTVNDALLILYPADHIFYCIPRKYIPEPADWERLMAAIRQAGIKQI